MEITLILGNGFDKNLGLKTSYKEFYDWYKNMPCDNDAIKEMKASIEKFTYGSDKDDSIINWGDAELAFGQYASKCNTYEEYRLCYEDIEDHIVDYLREQEKKFDISKIPEEKIITCIDELVKSITQDDNNIILNIITLNYTSCIYELFYKVEDKLKNREQKIVLKDFLYLHDSLDGQVTFGVGAIEQIRNESLRKRFPPAFLEQIIKDRQDILTSRNHYKRIDEIILRSHAIYCYGWSFGDTDLVLIKKIAMALKSGRMLYVFKYGFELQKHVRKAFEERIFNDNNKEYVCKKLLGHGHLNNDEYSIVYSKVKSKCNNCFEAIKKVV